MIKSGNSGMSEPVDWYKLLHVWLHDPVDKALDIRGHETRAARYASRALRWDVTRREIRASASLGDQLAAIAERLPLPTAGNGERAVGPEDGRIEVRHPVSAQTDMLEGLALDENDVAEMIDGIVAGLPDDPRSRFFALWRLLPERLGGTLARLPADTRVPDHTLIQHADIASGLWAASRGTHGRAYLSLSLGPVQRFIAAARSVRDLWSGSAILSWLTFQGTRPVIETLGPTALVYPALRGNPLMDLWLCGQDGFGNIVPFPSRESRRSPSIPNRFVALVPWGLDGVQAKSLADACSKEVHQAWQRLAADVHCRLDPILSGINRDWALRWQAQVDGFFEVSTSVLSEHDLNDETLARLIGGTGSFNDFWCDAAKVRGLANAIPRNERPSYDQQSAGRWQAQLETSARLMEAQRSIRHVPMTPQKAENENSPPKCSLLGSYEQMGPSDLKESSQFWKVASTINIEGVHLRAERFCAVALCKRFAGPATLARQLHLKPADLRFPDTATVAAAEWLDEAEIDLDKVRKDHHDWNGRWLHQKHLNDVGKGDPCPPRPIWEKIEAARRKEKPPTYYAILAMDADHMGHWLKGDYAPQVREILHPKLLNYYEQLGDQAKAGLDAKRPVGPALHASISEALNNFASHVAPRIVEKYKGTMIYSGGDDVLALLPARLAVACANELRCAFRGENKDSNIPPGWTKCGDNRLLLAMGNKATLSAGIAFVHFMEDLRLALEAARQAEKAAKDNGRDRLTLRFVRRSGEDSEGGLPWKFAAWFQKMVGVFAGDATDRWTYRLRQEMTTLQGSNIPDAAVSAEIRRLVDRTNEDDKSSNSTGPSGRDAEQWWQDFSKEERQRGSSSTAILETFTLLCQGASFVARGQDD